MIHNERPPPPNPVSTTAATPAEEAVVSRRNVGRALSALLGGLGAAALAGCVAPEADGASPDAEDLEPVADLDQALSSTADCIQWCDTYVELRALVGGTTTNSKNVAVVRGSTSGDPFVGGGGVFVWSIDTMTADNGGTLIATSINRTGCWIRLYEGAVNVRWFGAAGDGSTDDSEAIQRAVDLVRTLRKGVLWFPANKPAGYYRVTVPIVVDGPIHLEGSGPSATTIIGIGMAAGSHILDFDCAAADNVQHVTISGMTLRSNNQQPNGLHLKNVAYVSVRDVFFYMLYDGATIEGERCFGITFEQVVCNGCAHSGVIFASFPDGGGQFMFMACAFTARNGLVVSQDSHLSGLSLLGCNFEQCDINSIYVRGTVDGLTIHGCRTEGCDGSIDFQINPILGNLVTGLSIQGCSFDATTGAIVPIQLGGAGGAVRGFSICGNRTGRAAIETHLVGLNGDGHSGIIAGNYLTDPTAAAVNVVRPGVLVINNENGNGALAPTWTPPLTTPQYTVTNGSTDRALNVTSDSTASVAAVLGTLISDLKAIGLIK